MEFSYPPAVEAFRQEIRKFVLDNVKPEELDVLQRLEFGGTELGDRMYRLVGDRGWLGASWPKEYGGLGLSPLYQFVLVDELSYWHMPFGSLTTGSVAPTLMAFGTEQQKAEYLPKILTGEVDFALGYSEPNAGTDLANLQTRAVRDGDEWVINGQKVWNSGGHFATHEWLAVRTDTEAPKHRGISLLLVPLTSPGITVRPLWALGYNGGWDRTNEVFFDNVRVPTSALVGEENRGWYIIQNALDLERVSTGPNGALRRELDILIEQLGKIQAPGGGSPLDDPLVQREIGQLRTEIRACGTIALRNAQMIEQGLVPTKEGSMVKIFNSELHQKIASVGMNLLRRYGLLQLDQPDAPEDGYFEAHYRAAPIGRFGAGTNEIQRRIIATRGLGLPRG